MAVSSLEAGFVHLVKERRTIRVCLAQVLDERLEPVVEAEFLHLLEVIDDSLVASQNRSDFALQPQTRDLKIIL
jgi:hypothetical protein